MSHVSEMRLRNPTGMNRDGIARNTLSQSMLGNLLSWMILTIFYALNANKTRSCCLTVVMRTLPTSLQCSDFCPREILIAPVPRICLYISSTSHIDVLSYWFHIYISLNALCLMTQSSTSTVFSQSIHWSLLEFNDSIGDQFPPLTWYS